LDYEIDFFFRNAFGVIPNENRVMLPISIPT